MGLQALSRYYFKISNKAIDRKKGGKKGRRWRCEEVVVVVAGAAGL
jgi:hypothetical protein